MLAPRSVFGFVEPQTSPPPKRWDTVALVITAVATVFSVVAQGKQKPVYATILVAIAQTPSPVPRKAPDSANGASQGVTKKASNNKAPTPPFPSTVKPVTAN